MKLFYRNIYYCDNETSENIDFDIFIKNPQQMNIFIRD